MKKKSLPLLIPVIAITLFLIYCWSVLLFTDYDAQWQNYTGLVAFLVVIWQVFVNPPRATLFLGIFLLLGLFNLIAITPTITTQGLCIFQLCTPKLQGLFVVLFILYFALNLNILINMELDYKERKAARKQIKSQNTAAKEDR